MDIKVSIADMVKPESVAALRIEDDLAATIIPDRDGTRNSMSDHVAFIHFYTSRRPPNSNVLPGGVLEFDLCTFGY